MNLSTRPVAAAVRGHFGYGWLAAGVIAAGFALSPGSARAESNFVTGAGSLTANARLNFSIVIPRFLFLQVGTGTTLANNATIDTILFDMSLTPTAIGNGTPQAGTGGVPGPGAVNARVLGNSFAAAANLTATTTGAMSNGAGGTISWSEISVAAPTAIVVLPTPAAILAHPGSGPAPFADGASTSVSLTPVSRVINQAALWTFSYKNTNVPPSGTYGNTVANNGQVTYSIAMP